MECVRAVMRGRAKSSRQPIMMPLESRVLLSADLAESPVEGVLSSPAEALVMAGAAGGTAMAFGMGGGGVAGGGMGGGGMGGGGGEETAGNNLSFPVIWSDDATLALRGTYGTPVFDGAYTTIDGVNWYHQQDPLNTWQAQSVNWSKAPVNVDWVDWGDSLESQDWRVNSPVRVETTLYQDLVDVVDSVEDTRAAPMAGFVMQYLSGQGPSEMQGTNGVTYASTQATVYSGAARLTIQKLSTTRDDPLLSLTWDSASHQWVGDALAPVFSAAIGSEGPGGYSAEVNVSGKVVYGYNWRPTEPGDYRLTFSLDPITTRNAFFDDDTGIKPTVTEGEVAITAEPTTGGTAQIDVLKNLTYIDVRITGGQGSRPTSSRGGRSAPKAVVSSLSYSTKRIDAVAPATKKATAPAKLQGAKNARVNDVLGRKGALKL